MSPPNTRPVGASPLHSHRSDASYTPLLTAPRDFSRQRSLGIQDTDEEAGGHTDIVQFMAPAFFAEEDDELLTVGVMRLGAMEGRCSVSYNTADDSGKAGERYEACSGKLVFEDGEDVKYIEVRIIKTAFWSTTQDFTLSLHDAKNCKLGIYLQRTRVKVIDNDMFPTSRYADVANMASNAGVKQIGLVALWFEFVGLITNIHGVRWRVLLVILVDQLHNIYLYFQLNLMIYLVDDVLHVKMGAGETASETPLMEGEEEEEEAPLWFTSGPYGGRQHTAYAVGLLYAVPMLLMYVLEVIKVRLDLEGFIDSFLKVHLFNKYMNYTWDSRNCVDSHTIQEAMLRETFYVTEGYVASLKIIRFIGKLAVLSIFAAKESPASLPSVAAMPLIMGFFVRIATGFYNHRVVEAEGKLVDMVSVLQNVCDNLGVISEYKQTVRFFHHYKLEVKKVAEADMQVLVVKCHVQQVAKILGPAFICFHIMSKSNQVMDGAMSMGFFLASIRIFTELSTEFGELYHEFMLTSKAMTILQRLTVFYNLETDLQQRKGAHMRQMVLFKQERQRILSRPSSKSWDNILEFRTDKIQMWIEDASFNVPDQQSMGSGRFALQQASVKFSQGDIIAIVGGRGAGKKLLMRLLGGLIFPTKGYVFIPAHLRVLFVPQKICLLAGSVWENLTLGHPYAHQARVRRIVEGLKMDETLAQLDDYLQGDNEAEAEAEDANLGVHEGYTHDIDCLPHTETAKMQIARALIMNPEVLIMQGPLAHFQDQTSVDMWKVLHHHVRYRGYMLPEVEVNSRRPRTFLYSPTSGTFLPHCDHIWQVSPQGIHTRTPDQLTAEDYSKWHFNPPHLNRNISSSPRSLGQRDLTESSV